MTSLASNISTSAIRIFKMVAIFLLITATAISVLNVFSGLFLVKMSFFQLAISACLCIGYPWVALQFKRSLSR